MKRYELLARAILIALFAVAALGCSKNTVAPPPPPVDPVPPTNSGANLVHRIEYDWQHRSLDYLQLLTSDFNEFRKHTSDHLPITVQIKVVADDDWRVGRLVDDAIASKAKFNSRAAAQHEPDE